MSATGDLPDGLVIEIVNLRREPIVPGVLDAGEQKRRYRCGERRRRHLAVHSALRRVLGAALGRRPEAIAFGCDRFGKPFVDGCPDIAFSLSHRDDLAAIAWLQDPGGAPPVGVDVERRVAPPEAGAIIEQHFCLGEQVAYAALGEAARQEAFALLWTRKEAVAKAAGGVTALPFDRFTVGLDEGCAVEEIGLRRSWAVAPFAAEPDHVGAVAVLVNGGARP